MKRTAISFQGGSLSCLLAHGTLVGEIKGGGSTLLMHLPLHTTTACYYVQEFSANHSGSFVHIPIKPPPSTLAYFFPGEAPVLKQQVKNTNELVEQHIQSTRSPILCQDWHFVRAFHPVYHVRYQHRDKWGTWKGN